MNHKNNRLYENNIMKSAKFHKHCGNDKYTNTTEELLECSKCREREKIILSFGDSSKPEFANNYIKAINYINTCHNIINEVTKKISEHPLNLPNPTLNMPDLPNFLALYTSLLNQSNTENINTDDCNLQKVSSHQEICETTVDCIEEIYARETKNGCLHGSAKKPTQEVEAEPMASMMDEICNLSNINSHLLVKTAAAPETNKNLSSSKSKLSNKTWKCYESEDTDTDNVLKNYTNQINNSNDLRIHMEKNFEDDTYNKKNNMKTKIPFLNKTFNVEDENMSNIRTKPVNITPQPFHEDTTKYADENSDMNDSTLSSPRKGEYYNPTRKIQTITSFVSWRRICLITFLIAGFSRSFKTINMPIKIETHTRKNSAPITNINNEQAWNANEGIKPRPKSCKQSTAATKCRNISEFENTRHDSLSYLKSTYFHDSECRVLNPNREIRPPVYLTPHDLNASQQQNMLNQHVNAAMKKQNSTLKKTNFKASNKTGNCTLTNKHVKSHTRECGNPIVQTQNNIQLKNTISMDRSRSVVPLYKVENKPNDFFTENRRRSQVKIKKGQTVLKQCYSPSVISNKEETDQFYTDSDIDDDHFQNAIEISCIAANKRKISK